MYVAMMTGWAALMIAGMFEMGFTTFLKLTDGFTKWGYVFLFIASASASFFFLTQATKTIPLGTAYAVWTGIGAIGTAIIGVMFFKDPMTLARGFFLALLIGSIIGIKFVTGE